MARASAATLPADAKPAFFRQPFFAALVIAVVAVAAYLNSLGGPFVFDDEGSILANPTIRTLGRAWSPPTGDGGITVAGRPVVNFSLAINYATGGLNVWSYHATNLAVHLLAGLLLFGVVRRTLQSPAVALRFRAHAFEIALLGAVLWTLHPLQTESVTYVVQRAESLMGMFFLLTLWCFIRASEPEASPRWRWAAVGACLLGMATKEVMAMAPLVVLLYDRVFLAGSFRGAWRQRRGLHLALAATWVLLGWLVLRSGNRGGTFDLVDPRAWWRYELTQFVAVVRYLQLAVWPHPLAIDYGTFWIARPSAILPQAGLVGALVVATAIAWRRWPAAGFLGCWFFGILAPSSMLPGTIQMVVEHRMYLPLAAVVVALVLATFSLLGRKSVLALAAVAVVMGVTTARRNQDYASTITLFEDTVAKRPGNARAMALLADYYRRAGRLQEARAWLERSNAREPNVPAVLKNLGTVCQELRDFDRAVSCFEAALALKPGDVGALNNLGNALALLGRAPEGVSKLEEALRLAPDSATTRGNLASVLAQSGRPAEAAVQFEILLKTRPDDVDARLDYTNVLEALGRNAEAIAGLELASRARPRDADLHNRLGTALGRAGRVREGLEHFQEALRLDPKHEPARRNAAKAKQMLGGN